MLVVLGGREVQVVPVLVALLVLPAPPRECAVLRCAALRAAARSALLKLLAGLELVLAACSLPLACTNVRAGISGEVTASDASMQGGGLCVSTGTTAEVAVNALSGWGRRRQQR